MIGDAMEPAKLSSLDLNLLVILRELVRSRNVTEAGKSLGLSQSATSRALGRLRETFHDELLVRNGRKLELTARAAELASELDEILFRISEIMNPTDFDPLNAQGEIKVFGVELEIIAFLPRAFQIMREEAPGIHLSISAGTQDHFYLLREGLVDFVMTGLNVGQAQSGLRRVMLAQAENVCIMAVNHPLAKKNMSLREYLRFDHGVVNLTGRGESSVDQILHSSGLKRNLVLKAPSFTSAAYFCENSDMIFVMPKNIASELCRRHALIIKSPPSEIRQTQDFYLYWHDRNHGRPLSQWFRALLLGQTSLDE